MTAFTGLLAEMTQWSEVHRPRCPVCSFREKPDGACQALWVPSLTMPMKTYVYGRGDRGYCSLFPIEHLDGYAKNGVLGRIRSIGTFDAPTWKEAMQMFYDHNGYGVYQPVGAI